MAPEARRPLAKMLDGATLVAVEGERSRLAPAGMGDELRDMLAREDVQLRKALDGALTLGATDFAGVVWDSQRPDEQRTLARLFGLPGLVAVAPREEVLALVKQLRPKASATIANLARRPSSGAVPVALLGTETACVIFVTPGERGAA